jgi:monolysocardiolipin acyltransferase
MGISSTISKVFLYGLNRTEVIGLQDFLKILDERADPAKRQRGLITVSNHISVLDDPVLWGVLPLKYLYNPQNLRFGLGAHDICFTNKAFASFFTYGQVLPTHRLKHSQQGGLFQPTFTEAIRLLSTHPTLRTQSPLSISNFAPTYSTNGTDVVPCPSIHQRNSNAWVHVFPEGAVHQHGEVDCRYFKWGVSRLILESEPAPDLVPIFIDGFQHVMPEDRVFPRFLPRIGKRIKVAFGQKLDGESAFGDLRRRWRKLVESRSGLGKELGVIRDEQLRDGEEAREIRVEVAKRVRAEVMKLRRDLGYKEANPSYGSAETWAKDPKSSKKKYRSEVDGSLINQD